MYTYKSLSNHVTIRFPTTKRVGTITQKGLNTIKPQEDTKSTPKAKTSIETCTAIHNVQQNDDRKKNSMTTRTVTQNQI